MANNLVYKGTGSLVNGSEYNFIVNKIQSGTDSILTGSATISGATLKVLSPAGTGSPTTWGQMVQAGSGTTSAGSILWVVFGTPFTSPPFIAMSSNTDGAPVALGGSIIANGSALVVSVGASKLFSWIAVGGVGN